MATTTSTTTATTTTTFETKKNWTPSTPIISNPQNNNITNINNHNSNIMNNNIVNNTNMLNNNMLNTNNNILLQPSNQFITGTQVIQSSNTHFNNDSLYNGNLYSSNTKLYNNNVYNNNNLYNNTNLFPTNTNNNSRFAISPMIRLATPLVAYSPLVPPPPLFNLPSHANKFTKFYNNQRSLTAPDLHKKDFNNNNNFNNNTFSSNNNFNNNNNNFKHSKTNLYIKGLKPETTDKDLVTMCQQYGKIISTKAIIDQDTNECKGYGFVDYESEASAEIAVKALLSRGVQVQMAKQQEQDLTNLYVSSLPDTFSEADLKHLFTNLGGIVSIRILKDHNDRSRGVGFVRMASKECCEEAINLLNGKVLLNQREALTVKFADGGSRKRFNNMPHHNKWNEHNESNNHGVYDQMTAIGAATGFPQLAAVPRYIASTNALYQSPQGWLSYPQGFIMQTPILPNLQQNPPPATTIMSPDLMPHLTAQIGAFQIAPSPQYMHTNTGAFVQLSYPPLQPLHSYDDTCEQSAITFPMQYK